MARFTRQQILDRLNAKIRSGQPIVGGGAGIGLSAKCEEAGGIDLPTPFPRISYDEAMNLYGSDKPDLRFGHPMHEIDDLVPGCGFGVFEKALADGGTVRCLRAPGLGAWSRKQVDELEALARKLEDEARLSVWLDQWALVPGESWQPAMARGLDQAGCCVVCVGGQTPRGWFDEEIGRALSIQVSGRPYRVIPLLLPGAQTAFVDGFLELRTWVDLRAGLGDGGLEQSDALRRLVRGIQGDRFRPAVIRVRDRLIRARISNRRHVAC